MQNPTVILRTKSEESHPQQRLLIIAEVHGILHPPVRRAGCAQDDAEKKMTKQNVILNEARLIRRASEESHTM